LPFSNLELITKQNFWVFDSTPDNTDAVFEKAKRNMFSNYIGIGLPNAGYKICGRIIYSRIQNIAQAMLL
jgi:hypothetical protein